MSEEQITAADELEYVQDLVANLDLSPGHRISDLIEALEAEVEDEESDGDE
jgi:hypothetical protein